MHATKLIINAALTGMVPTRADNASLPVTPAQIAEDARVCYAAGASIFHLHARNDDETPTYRADIYSDIILRVRANCPDAIICVSTSGRTFKSFEQRSEALGLDGKAKPEMASLTLGSLNFPKQASVNEPSMIRALAERMYERGITPELEIFDLGMIDYAKHLIERKILREPFYFNLLLGSLGMLSATPFHLATLAMSLPSSATWAGAGIGRFQFSVNTMSVAMGGNVRVGLEDNLFYDAEKKLSASNLGLIERVAKFSRAAERAIATPAEAREIIGLAR